MKIIKWFISLFKRKPKVPVTFKGHIIGYMTKPSQFDISILTKQQKDENKR